MVILVGQREGSARGLFFQPVDVQFQTLALLLQRFDMRFAGAVESDAAFAEFVPEGCKLRLDLPLVGFKRFDPILNFFRAIRPARDQL
ncbi:MAG: hypothetical protein AAGC95_08110 [Pseudomonadota bacterium]